ncbi:MAG: DUF6884 domain-containing protein [Myxococcota bacterium]
MKIQIITSCTAKKAVGKSTKLPDFDELQLIRSGKAASPSHLRPLPAVEMYTGRQHLFVKRALAAASGDDSSLELFLYIVSAGYGLVSGSERIIPYESTFSNKNKAEIAKMAARLNLAQQMNKLLQKQSDLNLFLLGSKYLQACQFSSQTEVAAPSFFLTAPSASTLLPRAGIHIPLGRKEAARYKKTLIALKGYLAGIYLHGLQRNPSNHEYTTAGFFKTIQRELALTDL